MQIEIVNTADKWTTFHSRLFSLSFDVTAAFRYGKSNTHTFNPYQRERLEAEFFDFIVEAEISV